MQQAQVCIVGGGCVGLTLALGLAKNNISVHVIDAGNEPAPLTEQFANRVSAISLASQTLFTPLGAWDDILAHNE